MLRTPIGSQPVAWKNDRWEQRAVEGGEYMEGLNDIINIDG
jgi:hypothetical protein